MAENGAPPDEAVMIVMSRKSLRSGNRLVTKATSSRFSGDVRLQGQIGIFAPQCARRLELRRRGRSGPARRDGVKQPPLSMPSLDQRLGLAVADCAVSRKASGTLRSIMHLPATRSRLRLRASSNKASTDCG